MGEVAWLNGGEIDATEGEGGIFVSKDGWTKAANRVAKCKIA